MMKFLITVVLFGSNLSYGKDYLAFLKSKENLSKLMENGRKINEAEFPFTSNCWNTAMFVTGITNSPYVSTFNEIRVALESPLCRLLKKNEEIMAGDIMAFREILPYAPNENTGEFTKYILNDRHSNIYLDEEFVYSQNGVGEEISIQPIKKVIDIYLEPEYQTPDCMKVDEFEKFKGKCFTVISYYRCQSLKAYLESEDGKNLGGMEKLLLERSVSLDEEELSAKLIGGELALKKVREKRFILRFDLENLINETGLVEGSLLHLLSEKLEALANQR